MRTVEDLLEERNRLQAEVSKLEQEVATKEAWARLDMEVEKLRREKTKLMDRLLHLRQAQCHDPMRGRPAWEPQ